MFLSDRGVVLWALANNASNNNSFLSWRRPSRRFCVIYAAVTTFNELKRSFFKLKLKRLWVVFKC